jgi:hypothetical protein
MALNYKMTLGWAATGYQGPGDVATFAHFWSLRAYSNAKIGTNVLRLQRSDSVLQDFATIAGGGLDLVAISSWIGGLTANVVTLYDQAGSANLTPGFGPPFILNVVNGQPVMSFTAGAGQTLQSASGAVSVPSSPFTETFVMNWTGTETGSGWQFHYNFGGSASLVLQSGAPTTLDFYTGADSYANITKSTWLKVQWVAGAGGNALVNGMSTNTNSGTAYWGSGGATTAILGSPSSTAPGYQCTEWGIANGALSAAVQSQVELTQHTFWNI